MKKAKLVSFSLSFRFMLLLAFSMLALSVLFVSLLRLSVMNQQNSDLEKSVSQIEQTIFSGGTDEIAFLPLPYYITYAVFQEDGKQLLATNDSLLPLIKSDGKIRNYYVKNFFTDGNLNIRYLSKEIQISEKSVIIECAIDISNDSAAKMLLALPRLLLIVLIPIMGLSFLLSFLISRSTILAFKKLRSDYDREKAFTSNVSHELKTPISIIDGHANLLKRWGKDNPEQLSQSIESILHETENMNKIVSTLLEMSRIENGQLKVEPSSFFVTNFFANLKEEFKITHPDCKIQIIDDDFLEIETDEQKLHQIFTVILSNSVKFAGENCKIILKAQKSGNKTELSVTDNGKGFSEEELPHIFERFYKGDSSHDRNISGSGLGLSIAKTLVLALGGEIKAENSENGGAKISLKI